MGFVGGSNFYAYVDSVGKPSLDTNLYSYAFNNPAKYIDPLGLTNWAKVGEGIAIQLFGWANFYTGAVVAGLGIAEAAHGYVPGLHAIVPGGTLMGMGSLLIYEGGKLIYEGFAEPDFPVDGCNKRGTK
jgi:hypothetical protein